ncbi:7805_t:CDS:2, partial [Racocetra fulgida]
MLRNRYCLYGKRRNYIRHLRNTNNIHVDNEKHTNEEIDYEKINAREMPNNVENDYVSPNEELFGEAFDDEVLDNNMFKDEAPDDEAFDSEAFDETLEDFFYDEMLNDDEMTINSADDMLSEESDRIINQALNIEEMPSISGEFSQYFKNPTEALMFCWIQKHKIKNATILVELQNLVKIANIIILYNKSNNNDSSLIFIREILYKYQGRWKLRDVAYSYKHPSEFATLEIPEMEQLEKGIVMNILGNRSLIIASLSAITTNLPQGNNLTGVKRHGAIRGCCICNVVKNSWTSE